MSHLTVPAALTPTLESTRRTLRGILQNISGVIAFALLVAVPPVADAANAVLELIGVDYTITSPLVLALGAVLTAIAGIVTKLQNIVEGRDKIDTPEALAATVIELTDQINDTRTALAAAIAAAQHSSGSGLTALEIDADDEASALDPTPGVYTDTRSTTS